MGFDLAVTDHLLTTTRAVRKRLDLSRPVDPSVVVDCLRIAIQAPTGSNSQGWRWIVVDDPQVRAALADIYRRGSGPYFAAGRDLIAASGADPEHHAVLQSSEYLEAHLHEVPVLVVPCVVPRPPEPMSTADAAGIYGSILPAVWSFMLALRSRGLGSVLTTLHLIHEREAAELLGVPDHALQVAMIPVAHTIGDEFQPAARRPVEEIVYRNGWKRPLAP